MTDRMREIGSEYHADEHNGSTDMCEYIASAAATAGMYVRFLRCGRDAIGYIADEIAARNLSAETAGHIIVYMPALCCDSMILPFSVRGMEVRFYRLRDDLSADTGHLMSLIEEDDDALPVVLVMDFYGLTPTHEAVKTLRGSVPHAVIVEDVTHRVPDPDLFLSGEYRSDHYIGSIRKWMGVPDGSFVISDIPGHDIPSAPDTDFTRLRAVALEEKREYISSETRPRELKDHFRKLFGEAEDSLDDGRVPHAMSHTSAGALKNIDLPGMRRRRHDNFGTLKRLLLENELCGVLFDVLNPDAEIPVTPFMLPVILHTDRIRESAHTAAGRSVTRDRFETKLASRGVYAPVLWPIDARAAEVCAHSRYFAQNMLAFYIDQRYDDSDMRYVADVFGEELASYAR